MFMKCLGGTGLAMMCGDVLGSTLTLGMSDNSKRQDQKLFKEYLKFNTNGKLKIVQFTDVHYRATDEANSQPALDIMNEILDKEHPDLVIYTGDLVFSNGTFEGLDKVLDVVISRNIPFAVAWGNHDDEYDHTRTELYDYVQKKKGAVMPIRVSDVSPDYVIPIKAHNSDKVAAILYCIDSNSYTNIEAIGGYDWIHTEQIAWYCEVNKMFTTMNDGNPLPALAFFHIPIPEFRDALLDDHNRFFGVKAEGIASPKINSGFFSAIRERGDVMGILVGHDHDNDYAVMYKNVMLAYGRYSGGNTVYNDIANGARVIDMYEGERKFDSYIRLANDVIESKLSYPESFVIQSYNKIKK